MPRFTFDLASSSLHDLESYILPARDVPVVYNRKTVCETDVPESGVVECELDDEIIEKLRSGRSHIREFVEPDTNAISTRFLRLVEITIFDFD